MTAVVLETSRLAVLKWTGDEAGLLQDLHSTVEQTRYISAEIWSREKAEARLAGWIEEDRLYGVTKYRLIERDSGDFVGRAGFSYFPSEACFEIGYSLHPRYWGRGYATEMSAALRDWFFRRATAERFIGFAHPDNGASIRVMQKIGMVSRAPVDLDGLLCPAFEIKAGQGSAA